MAVTSLLLLWVVASVPLALLLGAALAHAGRTAPVLPSVVRIENRDLVYRLPDGRSLRIRPAATAPAAGTGVGG